MLTPSHLHTPRIERTPVGGQVKASTGAAAQRPRVAGILSTVGRWEPQMRSHSLLPGMHCTSVCVVMWDCGASPLASASAAAMPIVAN